MQLPWGRGPTAVTAWKVRYAGLHSMGQMIPPCVPSFRQSHDLLLYCSPVVLLYGCTDVLLYCGRPMSASAADRSSALRSTGATAACGSSAEAQQACDLRIDKDIAQRVGQHEGEGDGRACFTLFRVFYAQ